MEVKGSSLDDYCRGKGGGQGGETGLNPNDGSTELAEVQIPAMQTQKSKGKSKKCKLKFKTFDFCPVPLPFYFLLLNFCLVIGLLVILISGCGLIIGTLQSISVSPSSATVGLGKTQQFTAIGYDEYGNMLSVSATWEVTGGMGAIDQNGLFTAGNTVGSGSVIARADSLSDSASVTVTDKGSVSGIVRDAFLQPVNDFKVYISQDLSYYDNTDSAGSYTITDIPPGNYTLMTDENITYVSGSQEVTISTGETTTADFTLIPRLTIENQVINPMGYINITGRVRNNGNTTATGVTVAYTFYNINEFGRIPVSGGSANLGNIPASGTKDFAIFPIPAITTNDYVDWESVVAGSGY